MKRNRFLALVIALCLLAGLFPGKALAADPQVLLTKNGKTITSETTIEEVRTMFGKERLVTTSMFGGSAYSFYTDEYTDYLYLETNEKGQITTYSTFGDDFTSTAGNSGEKDDGYFWQLSGDQATNDGIIWGVTGYCKKHIGSIETVIERYESDPQYAIGILKHTVPMWHAVAKFHGWDAEITFNESVFYINRQLMEGGSNLYNYCVETNQSAHYSGISNTYYNYLLNRRAYVPNPLMYAQNANGYRIPENSYAVMDYSYASDIKVVGNLKDSFFDTTENVPYTEYEQKLLDNARSLYVKSVEVFNSAESYYTKEPQDESLPLEAGEIDPKILEGALGYLNAIRAAADLPLLELSEEMCINAQHKAVLTMYISKNNISNPNPHFPVQPEGVDDAFYARAQTGSGENLYYGNALTSITHALDDGYGDYITCGHRYNLINPYYQYAGFGESSGQGAHKFGGSQKFDGDVVGWPSKGVMLLESLSRNNPTFTVKFYNRYRPTSESGVVFRCLNSGDTVEFPPGMENTSGSFLYVTGNTVSYYSAQISLVVGNVYEITVTDVIDETTGETTDYTYRSVFETAVSGNSGDGNVQLSLDASSVTLTMGSVKKITADILPEDHPNQMVHWESSNTAVATVNENGYVTAHCVGTAIITASTDDGTKAACTVTVTEKNTVTRVFGADRYATSFKAADTLKSELGVQKFQNIVVASGTGFADALAGSYLAAVKNAPILLVRGANVNDVKNYIKSNLASGGTVYLLGGVNAVPASMETGLDGFTVKRLGGANRYDTNLLILTEAGVGDKDIIVCTGLNFADSLSASATGLPILLVKDGILPAQKEFLKVTSGKKIIVGGAAAVNGAVEKQLSSYGEVKRLAGNTRYDTSVLVAKEFFSAPTSAVLAYAQNFPDGLSGGPLAYALNAPLILTDNNKPTAAVNYATSLGIKDGYVLGGTGLISDKVVRDVFSLAESDPITAK